MKTRGRGGRGSVFSARVWGDSVKNETETETGDPNISGVLLYIYTHVYMYVCI